MVSEIGKYASVTKVLDEILRAMPTRPGVESVPTARAYGRISAGDVFSRENVPRHRSSHMDGYAVKSEDTTSASPTSPVALSVVGEVVLGEEPSSRIARGQAFRISTGSFLPGGADAVVPTEDAKAEGKRITVMVPFTSGRNVFRAGEDLKKGEAVISEGRAIRAQDAGLALSLGIQSVEVFRRPVVAMLATGSELTDSPVGEVGKQRNTHTAIFARLVEAAGGVPLDLGIAPDVRKEILAKAKKGLDSADMLMTMGGTSVGRKDLVGDVVSSLRPRAMFHGIRMDRGRVTGVAVVGQKPVLLMPGPIQGAMNAFLLSGLPIIRRMSGRKDGEIVVRARLKTGWEARRRFPHFVKVLYVSLGIGKTGLEAEPIVGDTESMTVLTKSNAYVVVPEETTSLRSGEAVDAFLLPGFSFA